MAMGILDMIGLVGVLIFALPAAGMGLAMLADGELVIGGGLVVVAVGMVLVEQYLWSPKEVLAKGAKDAVGGVGFDDEE